MRVIIAGSRGVTDAGRLNRAILAAQYDITYVVSGMCPDSPDMMGVAWAKQQDPHVPVMPMPAAWDALGKRAGMVRNCAMAKEADALIALWDGKSPGTRHMIAEAVSKGLYHYIDAACGKCGGLVNVAVYHLSAKGQRPELRARCRDCIVGGGGDVAFFDTFGMWGNHTLHVTEKRLRPEQPKLAMPLPPNTEAPFKLTFGSKAKALREYKQVKKLYQETGQLTL